MLYLKLLNYILFPNALLRIPKFRKIQQILNINFIPTNLKNLPENNHPILFSSNKQIEYLRKFEKSQKQTSFMTCSYLIELLKEKFDSKEKFNFLDYGGESIDFYLHFNMQFPNANYFIFNQSEILRQIQEIKKNYYLGKLNILFNEKEIFKINFDFVNFGSTIQYISHYYDLLKDIFKISNKYIFFSGITFYLSKKKNLINTTIVKQINLIPKIIYCYFFNKKSFIQFFKDNNYSKIFERTNSYNVNINFDNFKPDLSEIYYMDILFKK